ncbi:hypothetical protein evm_009529 [Chilo suppressalis]|nr:hypothetical protein evm_009529 [Chilo suppressalis]
MRALLSFALVACAYAYESFDTQSVKSGTKGGNSNYQYRGGDISRFYGANNTQYYGPGSINGASQHNFEVGVCYVEVPTASIARDPAHVPAGNGSRSDLSRIRSCCKGYKRNPYNYRICDPVCTAECINSLCTAPDTCSCYPDHVRNLGGICVATCPIGCQNGHCSGGECLCREGYKLDRDGKFCVPSCAAECDRIGNFPNQSSSLTTTQSPYGHRPLDQGQGQHQPNPGALPPQSGQRPHYSTYPITYNFTNTYNRPLYPDNQIAPNPSNPSTSNNGQNPQNPAWNPYSQNTVRPNQDTVYAHYPSGQTVNISIPSQYPPIYPSNQISPNTNTNQGGVTSDYPVNPNYDHNYPSGNQGPHSMYPYNQNPQGSNHPQPGGFYIYNSTGSSIISTTTSTYPQRPGSYPYPSYPYPGQQNSPYGHQSQGINSFDQNSYQTQDLSFSPTCSGPCINGACAENNICKCYPGYVVDEDDTSGRRCLPHCPGGCPNGYCASPYSCACDEGYYKDISIKGRAPCIKRIRRSAAEEQPNNVADLLVFEIPENEN